MASTTLTTTAAQPNFPIQANTFGNRVCGTFSGTALSASACAVLLVCKIPPTARNVQVTWAAIHTGATGAKLQFGIKSQDSVTASALQGNLDIAVTNKTSAQITAAYTPTWDDSAGETVKYVQCSVASGTVTAGFVLDYEVKYDFQPES